VFLLRTFDLEYWVVRAKWVIISATGALLLIALLFFGAQWGALGLNLLSQRGNLTISYEDPDLLSALIGHYQFASAMNASIAAASLGACFGLIPRMRRSSNRGIYFLLYFVSLGLFGLASVNYSVYSTIHYRLIDRTLDLSGLQNATIPRFEAHVAKSLGIVGELFLFTQQFLFGEGGFYVGMLIVIWVLIVVVPLLSLRTAVPGKEVGQTSLDEYVRRKVKKDETRDEQ
jgi:hypothetical protein